MSVRRTENPYSITVTDCKNGKKEQVSFALKLLIDKNYVEKIGGYGNSLVLHGFDGLPLPIACIEDIGDEDNFEVTLGSAYSFMDSSSYDPQYSSEPNTSPELEDIKASVSACHTWLHRASEAANNGDIRNAKYWIAAVRHRLLPYQE